MEHFQDIRKGLTESMNNINETLHKIENWDELLSIKEESLEEIKSLQETKIKPEFEKTKNIFDFFGFLFCAIHLIGVQACIIILNSLFNEIVEEFKLMSIGLPRENNFYQSIEINSYKELPEIDVGMVTSSIGITALKNYGFICTNITFQFISMLWMLFLFIFFNFHTDDKLLKNYTGLEIFILILTYIILSILVGCSSTLALKHYSDLYHEVFLFKASNKDLNKSIMFYIFSGKSAFIIIVINRKIFTSFKNISSKSVLIWTVMICFICFFLSMIFYYLYMIPVSRKKKNLKENEDEKNTNQINIIKTKNQIENENKEKIEN